MSKFTFKCLLTKVMTLFAVMLICTSVQAFEWTSWTSEENEPRTCDFDKFQSGFGCSGSYCDSVKLECHSPGIDQIANRHWLPQVSEEGGGVRFCPWGEFVAGVSTSGRYSDNVSLECADAAGVTWTSCYWTNWKSEESGGRLYFPVGYYGTGIQCSGSYCDNKRFYVCRTH